MSRRNFKDNCNSASQIRGALDPSNEGGFFITVQSIWKDRAQIPPTF